MNKILLFLFAIGVLSCGDKNARGTTDTYKITNVVEDNVSPTVDISNYAIIENEDRKEDAKKILILKRSWPLVMQSPSRAGFDSLLSQNFTFTGDGHLLNREEYITDRTKPSDWKITHVKYDNLTLQFFENIALLTYRNEVTNVNIHSKETEVEYISWADIYVLEDKKWKIGACHTVDFRMEKK